MKKETGLKEFIVECEICSWSHKISAEDEADAENQAEKLHGRSSPHDISAKIVEKTNPYY